MIILTFMTQDHSSVSPLGMMREVPACEMSAGQLLLPSVAAWADETAASHSDDVFSATLVTEQKYVCTQSALSHSQKGQAIARTVNLSFLH